MSNKISQNILNLNELREQGVEPWQVPTLLRKKQLLKVEHGTYVYRDFAENLNRDEKALARIVTVAKNMKKPVLSFASAALWYGVPLIHQPSYVHLSIAGNSGYRRPDVKIHRNQTEAVETARMLNGLRVTSPEQTLSDCAISLSTVNALSTAHYLLNQRLISYPGVDQALTQPRRYHTNRALKVNARINPACESPLETMIWNLICDWEMERPDQQVVIDTGYGSRYRVDFCWREKGVILEADGLIKYSGVYGDPAEVIRNERSRQRALERMGWTVLRVEWSEVVNNSEGFRARLAQVGVH